MLTSSELSEGDHHFLQFKQQYGNILQHSLNGQARRGKKALVPSSAHPTLEVELSLIKALQVAGFSPAVLFFRKESSYLAKYYKLAGVSEFHLWSDFTDPMGLTPTDADPFSLAAAETIVAQHVSIQELLGFEHAGARVGRIATATALRQLRSGTLDLNSDQFRRTLVRQVAIAMMSAKAAQGILRRVRPSFVVFVDTEYTPKGELFDNCIESGIEAIAYDAAHKSNALMLKRYSNENRDEHAWSLSRESWQRLLNMEWTDARREQLHQEIYRTYASGDWYSTVGTQFNKQFMNGDAIREQLNLDPAKKTAFIFPHILWDGAFFWGKNLFPSFEEWLIETVRAACANNKVNWVIKIHPAHVGKALQEGFRGEPAEIVSLRQHIGELPPHICLILPDSKISTYSLFEVMDYCLTVRGTVGIEAARLGIPVLTPGTGRYTHRGFTIDTDTREQFFERVAHIQDIPRLSLAQRELAERYAYGLFVIRPLALETVTFEYLKNGDEASACKITSKDNIRIKSSINARNQGDWFRAPDFKDLVGWLGNSTQQDFLACLPGL